MKSVNSAFTSLSTLPNNSSGILVLELVFAFLIVAGGFICRKLGIQPPSIYEFLRKHIIIVFVILYMGCNFIRSYITKTRAFEVYLGERLIASTLKSGEIIKVQELIKLVEHNLH